MTAPAIDRLLRSHGLTDATVDRLAGDASTRRYHRATVPGRSVVVMEHGAPIPPDGDGEDPFPFTRWRDFLAALGIRVPRVLAADRPQGLVLLEDLGDELLQWRVERAGVDACADLYRHAVEIGGRLATDGTARFTPDAGDTDDPLTPARLAVEMDFFLEHAAPLAAARGSLAVLREPLHELCTDVHRTDGGDLRELVLCHRDYHARNLLVVKDEKEESDGETLAVIDFQDTRRGPRAYDLASLAYDPYVSLPAGLIRELVDGWRPPAVAAAEWDREVDLAAGQRLIKAAGSYAYLVGRGREEYRQWFRPALERALERLADWRHRPVLAGTLAAAGFVSSPS